jgi:hypothetical protein
MKALRIYDDLLDDFACQSLSPKDFKALLMAAVRGEENIFSRFVQEEPWPNNRPHIPKWASIRKGVLKRDNFTCRYCGATGVRMECDHVIPVSRGGSSEMSNLVASCRKCNGSKASKTPEEWKRDVTPCNAPQNTEIAQGEM